MGFRDYRLGGALLAAAALHILPVMPSTTVGRKAREEIAQTLHLSSREVSPAHTQTLAKTRDELKLQLAAALHPTTIEVTEREKVAEINAFRESIRLNDGEFSDHVFRLYLFSQPVTPERRAKVNRAKEKYHLLRSELAIMLNQGIAVQHALPQVMAKMRYEAAFEDLAEAVELERGNCTVASIVSMMLLADTGFTSHLYLRYEATNPYTNVGHIAPLLKYDDGYQWDIMTGGRSSRVGVVVPVSYLPDLYAIQHDLPAQRRRYPLVKIQGENLFGGVRVPSHLYDRGGTTYFSNTLIPPYNPHPNIPDTARSISYETSSALFDARFLRPFTPPPVRDGLALPTGSSQEGLILFETPPLLDGPIPTIPLQPIPTRLAEFTPSADLTELDRLASAQVMQFSQEREPNRRLLSLARIVGLYRQIEDTIHVQGYQDQDHLNMATYAHTRAERYYAEGARLLKTCRNNACVPTQGMLSNGIQDLAYLGDNGIELLSELEGEYLSTHPDFFQLDGGASPNGMNMDEWVNIVLLLIFNPATREAQLVTISQLPIASQVALCRHIRAGSLVSEREKAQAFSRLLNSRQETFAKIVRTEESLADYYYFYGLFDSAHYPPNEDYNTIRGIVSERVRQNNLPDTVVEPFMTSLVEDRLLFGISESATAVPPANRRRPIVNTIQAWSVVETTNGENSLYSRRMLSEATLLLSQHQEMLQAWYDYPFSPPPDPQMVNGRVEVDIRPQEIPGYRAWDEERQAQELNFRRNYFSSH